MNFRIADTFTSSLAKLTGDEQKAVKTTAFDLQMNPANPGMKFHKLGRAKDKQFWSVRVSSDIRLIVHRTDKSLMLCYVDHHDAAYRWAERRRIERHPTTGAAQLVEVRETVREVEVPVYVEAAQPAVPDASPKPALFASVDEQSLLSYGVPQDWLAEAKEVDEDGLFELVEHLPREAGEALLELATGGTPELPIAAPAEADPFEHPDAQRRFRLMADSKELARALEAPWETWSVFLPPDQRELVSKTFNGAARVSGSAGTGKTVVALHRAAQLARQNPGAKVLLATFSQALANQLRRKLRRLLDGEPEISARVMIRSLDEVGLEVYERANGKVKVATATMIHAIVRQSCRSVDIGLFAPSFVEREWADVVDAWQLESWEAYREVTRLGRKTRLREKQRQQLWRVFERVREELRNRGLTTMSQVFSGATAAVATDGRSLADSAVIDEAQDISVPQLRFLAAMAGQKSNGLFFAGDLGQRIFQTPFSWRSLGVDVRGRSAILRVNYRTSHEIRRQADRLLPPEIADVDGNTESRKGTISAFGGPSPRIEVVEDESAERDVVVQWLKERTQQGVAPSDIAVCVRSESHYDRARAVIEAAGLSAHAVDHSSESKRGSVAVVTMHLAKGLEFRAVAVVACDEDVVPLQERLESIGDDAELEEVYNTERHLLYVACTRARDTLLVTGIYPGSEFLADLTQFQGL